MPWYWQDWFVVLSLIVVFPVGLALMWTRRPPWRPGVRWGASSVVVGFAAIVIAVAASSAPHVPTSPTSGSQASPAVGGAAPQSSALFSPGLAPPPDATTPAATPTPQPTPVPTPVSAAPPPPTAQPVNLCGAPPNPWNYNFCGGGLITSPPGSFCRYFDCIPSFSQSTNGYVVECADGMFSHAGGRSGACSSHGGVSRPLFS
ncbi:MAG TPA: hypothetical protein VF155_09480 [Candidatus Dormibacteraeota bacterium]